MSEIASVMFPFNDAEILELTAGDTAQNLTIKSHGTIIDGVTNEATVNRTLNLTPGEGLRTGAIVFVRTQTNGVENTIFGTGVTGVTYAGVAGTIFTTMLVFNGTAFEQFGAALNIN